MKYALLLMGHHAGPRCETDSGPDPEKFFEFDKEITDAGIVVTSFALEDDHNAGVRVSTDESGERVSTSGPFAEVQEYLGGAYIIEVENIDEALAWAKKSPGSLPGGHVEVRVVAPY